MAGIPTFMILNTLVPHQVSTRELAGKLQVKYGISVLVMDCKNLKKDDVLNCLFRLPQEPQEQQRIADCLLSVDELISTEIAKLDQLKAHKKGLMQQQFPKLL